LRGTVICITNNHFPEIAKEGVNMDKRFSLLYFIVALVVLSMAVFLFFSPEDNAPHTFGLPQMHAPDLDNEVDSGPKYAPEFNLIAGICTLLLVCYLFWACYRKFQTDSQADLIAMQDSLYEISLATGRTEYDLFCISAEEWSIPSERIDQDYKRYMIEQVMPHYAKDFARKNQTHLDESLVNKKEVEPTSWADWAKALLVFPGSVFFLFSMAVFFD